MDRREQRGLVIAERHKLKPAGGLWYVPSESSGDRYRVDPAAGRCTCPDFELRGVKCKHLWAVEFTVRRETTRTEETACASDGESVTLTRTVTETVKTVARVTYRQDWPAYNAAQTNEARHFPELLHGLCQGIVQPPAGKGRPRLPLADMVFCAVFKSTPPSRAGGPTATSPSVSGGALSTRFPTTTACSAISKILTLRRS